MNNTDKKSNLSTFLKIYAYYLLFVNCCYIILYFFDPFSKVNLITDIVVVIFLIFSIVVSLSRKKYYFPGISEMSEYLYWTSTHLIQTTILMISYYFRDVSIYFFYFNAFISIIYIMLIISTYQTKPWALNSIRSRRDRILFLIKKSKLTDEELHSLTNTIMEERKKDLKEPRIWRIYKIILAFIIALLINTYAQPLLDVIKTISFIN